MFEGLFQPTHLILILIIALIVFGPGKLPEIGSALGKSIREFKKSTREMTGELTDSVNEIKRPIKEITQPIADLKATSTDSAPATNSKVCSKCASPSPGANKFCGNCGAELPTS